MWRATERMIRSALRGIVAIASLGLRIYAVLVGLAIVGVLLSGLIVLIGRLLGHDW